MSKEYEVTLCQHVAGTELLGSIYAKDIGEARKEAVRRWAETPVMSWFGFEDVTEQYVEEVIPQQPVCEYCSRGMNPNYFMVNKSTFSKGFARCSCGQYACLYSVMEEYTSYTIKQQKEGGLI
jgi:hypothetical protein